MIYCFFEWVVKWLKIIFKPESQLEYLVVTGKCSTERRVVLGIPIYPLKTDDVMKVSDLAQDLRKLNNKETIIFSGYEDTCQESAKELCKYFGCKYTCCSALDNSPDDQGHRNYYYSLVSKKVKLYARRYKNIIIMAGPIVGSEYPPFFADRTLDSQKYVSGYYLKAGDAIVIACKDSSNPKRDYIYDWPMHKGNSVQL